jgi:hypothetical protein
MNVPVPPSDFDTAESSRSTEAFAWINSDKSPEVSDATVREVLPQLAVQLRDRFSLSLSETVELLHYVSVDCETRPALAEIEQIAEETYSADRKATAARPGKRYASVMTTESLFERLVEIQKKAAPLAQAEENERPRLKRRDQRSARAKARNAAHRRAIARGIPKQVKFIPKRRWPSTGRRGGSQAPPGASVLDRIVRSMQPGHSYALSDLGSLAHLTESERIGVRLFSHGHLTMRRNPEFRRKGVPGSTELSAGTEEPHYLYTLTPAGEQRRKFLLALTENDASHVTSKAES